MSQEYVGSDYSGTTGVTALDVVMAAAVQVGDLIVVPVRWGGTAAATPITDTLGNTYTQIMTGGGGVTMYRAVSTGSCGAGENTVTATQTAAARLGVAVHHYRGMMADPLDVYTDVNEGTATTSSTDAFTPSQANVIIVAAWGGSVTPTPEADYGGANLEGPGGGRLCTCHRIVTEQLTDEVVSWTHSGATYACCAAVFKEAAAGGGQPPRFARRRR